MASLPRRLDIELAGLTLAVVHGSLTEINRFVFASTPDRVKALDLAVTGVDGVVAGHCGLPFTQVIQDRLWHNPGVVGLPANDGTPRVWFSILTPGPEPRSLVVEHLTLAYDDKTAATKMRVAGLPEGYADALTIGLTQLRKRVKTLFQFPNKRGRSRHGLPVRTIHSIFSTNRRLSCRCVWDCPACPDNTAPSWPIGRRSK